MVEIRPVMYQQSQEKRSKVSRHLENAVVTAGGIGATAYLFKKVPKIWDLAQYAQRSDNSGCPVKTLLTKKQRMAVKIKNGFEKLGEMIFRGEIGKTIERYTKLDCAHCSPDFISKQIRYRKGTHAVLLTTLLTALNILAQGIYQAGKINGDK